jgi:8-amino-7-oxononanoate synthase
MRQLEDMNRRDGHSTRWLRYHTIRRQSNDQRRGTAVSSNKLKIIQSPVGAEMILDGRRYINFGGSSYLGLSTSREIAEAGVEALRASGGGYQFVRQFDIATPAHLAAEAEVARFFDAEAGMYIAAGYYFGLITIAAMRGEFSRIFFDDLAHYSLQEAIAASNLPSHSYKHLDAEDLAAQLKQHMRANEKPLIVTDAMYSTFGKIAPLDALARAMAPYGGRLLVDESHGFGILGDLGRGAAEHHNIPAASVVIGGSTGKGFGVVGGIIAASEDEIAKFRGTPASRGAAAGLPAAAAMCAKSLRYVREHPELLQRLRANTAYAKSGLRKLGLDVGDSIAPVATFSAGTEESMRALQEKLMADGIYVFHTTYIGAGAAGVIRCGIFADHTKEHIDRLLDALRRLL